MSLPESLSALMAQRLQISLADDGVHLRRIGRFGGVSATAERLPLVDGGDGPLWMPWLTALRIWFQGQGSRHYVVDVIVADRFVRYQHLPWRQGLGGEREWRAYAGHRFREVFGELSKQWKISLTDETPGRARIACAMDEGLLEALKAMEKRRFQLRSVQPAFIANFNRLRRQCKGGRFGFANIEGERICLALMDGGLCVGLRNEGMADGWATALAGLNQRVALQAGVAHSEAYPIYLNGAPRDGAPKLLGMHPLHRLGGTA